MAGVLGLLAMAAPGQADTAAPAACAARYMAPRAPQRLTRTLIRDLKDGKQIIVSRSYRVRFIRQGHGWRVEGEQVDAQVDSPPPLTAMAALERARVDHETLPITLDQAGRIVPGPVRVAPPSPENARAVADILAKARLTPAQRATMEAVTHAMLAPGANVPTPWPEDVFDAAAGTRETVTHPALPDGTQGDVMITITASQGDCGHDGQPVSRRMQRDVVTRLGDSTRHTREVWTLEPEAAAR